MGLLGAVLRLAAKKSAQSFEENRKKTIQAYENSGLIQFVDKHTELYALLSRYSFLPAMYFENPTDNKKREILYEMVSKLIKKQEDVLAIKGKKTYFIIAGSITGKATNGMIAFEDGIFDGGFTSNFYPVSDIEGFALDKKGATYVVINGKSHLLIGADTKVIKQTHFGEKETSFVHLLRAIYNK